MKKTTFLAVALVLGIIGYGCADNKNDTGTQPISNKQKVTERLKSIETGDMSSDAYMNPDKYIQHNLGIADGHEGFAEVMANLPPGSARVNTVRVFEDGDYVFAHTDYDFFGPTIGIDIFRFENGLIVEHWDNLQPTPEALNPSGRSMVDGETRLTDINKTGENKQLIYRFAQDILLAQNPDNLALYFNGDSYIQHNPTMADGVAAYRQMLAELAANESTMAHTIHKIFGEGNFVLLLTEGTLAGEATAYYDLFRITDGKIVEHWDIVEAIPDVSEWKNQSGKFNFPY